MNGGHETRHPSVWKKWKIKIIQRPLCRDNTFTVGRYNISKVENCSKSKSETTFTQKKPESWICKQNFFLMHGFPNMIFLSFPDLLRKWRFCSKIHFNCNILQNKVVFVFNNPSQYGLDSIEWWSSCTPYRSVLLRTVYPAGSVKTRKHS